MFFGLACRSDATIFPDLYLYPPLAAAARADVRSATTIARAKPDFFRTSAIRLCTEQSSPFSNNVPLDFHGICIDRAPAIVLSMQGRLISARIRFVNRTYGLNSIDAWWLSG